MSPESRALHVPETGIVDYGGFCKKLAQLLTAGGHEIRLGTAVIGAREEADRFVVETTKGDVEVGYLVNCAGLQSDKVAKLAGAKPSLQIGAVPGRVLRADEGSRAPV